MLDKDKFFFHFWKGKQLFAFHGQQNPSLLRCLLLKEEFAPRGANFSL